LLHQLCHSCLVLWKPCLQTEIALCTMEIDCVIPSIACKDLFPIVIMVHSLSSTVSLYYGLISNLHIKIHEDNFGAISLVGLESCRMRTHSKHYAIKYDWFLEHTCNHLGDLFIKVCL
jgi:hypothetical protein